MAPITLKSFEVEGNLAQKDVRTNDLGKTSYGAKGALKADLQQGLKAQLKISDRTINSVRARACARAGERPACLRDRMIPSLIAAPARAAGQQLQPAAGGRVHRGHQGRCGAAAARRGAIRARGRVGWWHLQLRRMWASLTRARAAAAAARAAQTPPSSRTTCGTSRLA